MDMDMDDPEMAAALAASMMDAGGGPPPGADAGGGGSAVEAMMMAETSSAAALEALETIKGTVPAELHASLDECRALYESKRWHELTDHLDSCLGMAGWQASDATKGALVELYNSFISTFWEKLNRKRLASFMIKAANCVSAGPEARLSFLQEGSSKLLTERTPDAEAGLVLRCEMAGIVLETGETKECKKMVEEIEEKLDGMTGCENRTYSTFHKAAALYYKAMNDAEAYYKAALQFLGYVDLADLSAEEQHGWAFDIGKAALLGEKVFNFGELLVHPVLKSLEGSGEAWMTELLLAFNAGDVVAYKAATQAHGASISSQPELVAGKTSLEQKIAILALMTLVFNRAGDERVLAFSDIEEATGVGGDGVEFLVMKAVCIGVIDATIDEVEGEVAVTRVQPRVLTVDALGVMADKLEKWCGVVKETLVMVEEASPELLA